MFSDLVRVYSVLTVCMLYVSGLHNNFTWMAMKMYTKLLVVSLSLSLFLSLGLIAFFWIKFEWCAFNRGHQETTITRNGTHELKSRRWCLIQNIAQFIQYSYGNSAASHWILYKWLWLWLWLPSSPTGSIHTIPCGFLMLSFVFSSVFPALLFCCNGFYVWNVPSMWVLICSCSC